MIRRLTRLPTIEREQPHSVGGLGEFTCGDSEPWEESANEIVRRLPGQELGPRDGLLVARDGETLVGVVAWAAGRLGKYLVGVRLDVIALAAAFRGAYVRDRDDRVASRLLRRTLLEIATDHRDEPMPHCWAGIHPNNTRSVVLFESEGFVKVPELHGKDFVIWFREGDEDMGPTGSGTE